MRNLKTIFSTILMCFLYQASFAQWPTPPIENLTTNITVEYNGNVINITANGEDVIANVMNEWSAIATTTFVSAIESPIVGLCQKPGAGNESKFYVLRENGSVSEYSMSISSGNLIRTPIGSIGEWNLNVNSPGVTKVIGDALYVLNDGFVGTSNDNGLTWAYDTTGTGGYIRDLAMDTAQNVYATDGSRVLYQAASGSTWANLPSFPAGKAPQSVYVDRQDRIFVGTNNNGVYHSTTAGSSWTQGATGLTSVSCKRMCDDVFGNVYLINNGGTQLLRSTDAGMTWTRIDTPITDRFAPASGSPMYINDVKGDSVLEAVTAVGRFFSRDQGTTWTMYNQGLRAKALNGLYKAPTGRIIETSPSGIFYLNAGDSVWHQPLPVDGYASVGRIQTDTLGNMYVNSVTAHSAAPIMRSSDYGATWLPDTMGLWQITANAGGYYADEAGNEHIANNDYSLGATTYKKNPGGTFILDTMGIGIPSHLYDNINAFGSDHNGYLYLAGSFTGTPNIWRRPFAGGAWTPDTLGSKGATFLAMTSDRNHNIIASPMYNNSGLYYRNNGTWTAIAYPTGMSSFANVTAMATDSSNGVIVAFSSYDYVHSVNVGLGIYCTHDYGATWHLVGLDSVYITQMVNEGDSTYAITTNNGIYSLTCAGVVVNPNGIAQVTQTASIGLALYPNPANGICHAVLTSQVSARGEFIVYDVMGRTMIDMPVEANTKEVTFDTKEMPKGIYFCTWRGEGESVPVRKLAVEK